MTFAESQVLNQRIKMLHALFNMLSGDVAPLTMSAIGEWEMWIVQLEKDGHEPERALREVHSDMLRYNARQKDSNYLRKMTWRNTIRDRDEFARRLAQAQSKQREIEAKKRAPANGPREKILQATGRSIDQPREVATPERVLRESRAFEEFRKWREESGL